MKYLHHLITIIKHKYYVGRECFKVGLYWQGIVHDLSKFSIVEFFSSAKYYQGTSSPICAEKEKKGYSLAWLNHKAKNKHHWEYWIDFDYKTGKVISIEIPEKYVLEMVCDMIGASKTYLNVKFDKTEPLKYFVDKSPMWHMHKESKELLRKYLTDYSKII